MPAWWSARRPMPQGRGTRLVERRIPPMAGESPSACADGFVHLPPLLPRESGRLLRQHVSMARSQPARLKMK